MEQDQWIISLFPGDGSILLPMHSTKKPLWHGWDEPRHCNADWELHLITKGTCYIDVDDRHCQMQGGQAILIAPGQYHRPKSLPGSFERFTLSFMLQSPSLKQALHDRVPTALVIETDPSLCSLATAIADEWGSYRAFSQSCTQALLTQFLICIFRLLSLDEQKSPPANVIKGKDLTALIDAYFEQHFADPAGENDLANWLHLSRRQLVRILKDTYGMSFRQKLIHTRMDYAAWLLRTTDMKISQISSAVGYSSEAAFFQVFGKHFGLTPRNYRLQKKNS